MTCDRFPDTEECLDIFEESIKILEDLESNLEPEDLTVDVQLYQLYDMAEDVVESSRIRRAESGLAQRQSGDYTL